jgi:hypothetical protein
MNGINISSAQVQQAQADAQAILQASGISEEDVQLIRADLTAIISPAKTRLGR